MVGLDRAMVEDNGDEFTMTDLLTLSIDGSVATQPRATAVFAQAHKLAYLEQSIPK
jgi:hypothetical protein